MSISIQIFYIFNHFKTYFLARNENGNMILLVEIQISAFHEFQPLPLVTGDKSAKPCRVDQNTSIAVVQVADNQVAKEVTNIYERSGEGLYFFWPQLYSIACRAKVVISDRVVIATEFL